MKRARRMPGTARRMLETALPLLALLCATWTHAAELVLEIAHHNQVHRYGSAELLPQPALVPL